MANFWSDLGDFIGIGAARRAHERSMQASNTAIQRQVADAKAAGINPAMLYSSGASGASSPTSGIQSASFGPNLNGVSSVINSVANLSKSFNHDKQNNNDISLSQAMKAVHTVSKLLLKK